VGGGYEEKLQGEINFVKIYLGCFLETKCPRLYRKNIFLINGLHITWL
jgi:hypothetical protein